jgi:hypothetical protein
MQRNLKLNRSASQMDAQAAQPVATNFAQQDAPQAQNAPAQQPAPPPLQQTDFRISEADFDSDTFAKAKTIDDYIQPLAPDDPGGEGRGTAPELDDPQPGFGGGSVEDMGGGSGVPSMDENEALAETRKLMDMRETGQALLISFVADGSAAGYQKYNYEPWQKDLLVRAWAPIIQSKNLRVNPYLQILYAEGISSGPLFVLMFKNRKIRMENEDLRRQVQQLNREKMQMQQATAAASPGNEVPPPRNVQIRSDIKTLWKVDDNGFFMHGTDKARTYIPEPQRKDKPVLTPDNYERLCKHNTKARIDLIFKTGVANAG